MALSRRSLVSTIGVLSIASAVYTAKNAIQDDRYDHYVRVINFRDDEQRVTAEVEIDGESKTHGPKNIAGDETWNLVNIDRSGELRVEFEMSGGVTRQKSHQIPEVSGPRKSQTNLELKSDGTKVIRVLVED